MNKSPPSHRNQIAVRCDPQLNPMWLTSLPKTDSYHAVKICQDLPSLQTGSLSSSLRIIGLLQLLQWTKISALRMCFLGPNWFTSQKNLLDLWVPGLTILYPPNLVDNVPSDGCPPAEKVLPRKRTASTSGRVQGTGRAQNMGAWLRMRKTGTIFTPCVLFFLFLIANHPILGVTSWPESRAPWSSAKQNLLVSAYPEDVLQNKCTRLEIMLLILMIPSCLKKKGQTGLESTPFRTHQPGMTCSSCGPYIHCKWRRCGFWTVLRAALAPSKVFDETCGSFAALQPWWRCSVGV